MSILFRVQPEHTRLSGEGEPTGWVGGCWKCEFPPLYELFPSFFFVLIGASVDLDARPVDEPGRDRSPSA